MIPIRLTLEAFGPFPTRQEINFTAFENDRIFLITGPTGSGKTTVFDAITFCLFGMASGGVRESDSFKSHFADENTVCFAEFEFLVHGKRYRVHRKPIQYRRKRNGNLSKDNSTAILTLEDGTILSGTQTVDAKLQEILGINADQFKKIVMLPQGEFRKFLSDDVDEKQKTLRKIFSTEKLDAFTEKLKQNVSDAQAEIASLLAKCDAVAETIQTDGNASLEAAVQQTPRLYGALLELLQEDIAEQTKQVNETKKTIERLEQTISELRPEAASEQNRKFLRREECRSEWNALLAQKSYFAELEQQLSAYRAIREIGAYADAASRADSELSTLKRSQAEEQAALCKATKSEQTAKAMYSDAKTAQEHLPELLLLEEQWKNSLQTVASLSEIQIQYSAAKHRLLEMTASAEQWRTLRKYAEKQERLKLVSENFKAFSEAHDAIIRCGVLNQAFLTASNAYQTAMNTFLESQAALLAGELIQGKPCPVCGSTEHPSPARCNSCTLTREELEAEKERYEEAARRSKEQQGSCGPLLKAVGFTCREHSRLSEYLPELEVAMTERAAEMDSLRQEMEKAKVSLPEISVRNCSVSVIEEGQSKAEASLAAEREKLSILEKQIENLRSGLQTQIGGEVTSNTEEVIRQKCREIEAEITQRNTRLEQSRTNWENCLREIERSKEAVRQLSEQLLTRETARQEAEDAFRRLLDQAGLSEEEFLTCRRESAAAESIERELNAWREKTVRLQGILDNLDAELEGKSPVDLEALLKWQTDLTNELTHARESNSAALLRCRINEEARQKLSALWKDSGEKEAIWQEKMQLCEIASGKRSDKLSFERYVLAGYFSEVIENANLRLERMTQSRYTLKRRTEREKGNRSSGLSLEVFDAYTGSTRHINTLSGGESFKIALSLALGLADIISQTSGGIELNTMFIDEGFGSLDQTSLEAAVECLNELKSSGRYIGIISHVSELKEKIPAKLLVIQSPEGSRLEVQTN